MLFFFGRQKVNTTGLRLNRSRRPTAFLHIPNPEHRTEDDWLQLGKEQELDGDILTALQTYNDALGRFEESFELHKAEGRLYASFLRFEEAKRDLEAVHARNTSDAEISYYLGIAYDGLGQDREARESYEAAARQSGFRAAAGLRLAELSARAGNPKQAESYLRSECTPLLMIFALRKSWPRF